MHNIGFFLRRLPLIAVLLVLKLLLPIVNSVPFVIAQPVYLINRVLSKYQIYQILWFTLPKWGGVRFDSFCSPRVPPENLKLPLS